MTPEEVAGLIDYVIAMDGRVVTDLTVPAWLDALADVPADVATEAVRRHYRHSAERLLPHHVVAFAEAHDRRDEHLGAQQGKCPFRDCRCSHTAPCDVGWIENDDGSVRPCPTCRPAQAAIVDDSAGRDPGPSRLAELRDRGKFASN